MKSLHFAIITHFPMTLTFCLYINIISAKGHFKHAKIGIDALVSPIEAYMYAGYLSG